MNGRLRGAVGALAIVAALAAPATAAEPPQGEEEPPRCHGARATIVGTEGPDVIQGTPGRDVIVGLGGDDEITGSLGNDVICGGPGSDLIHGGRGNDVLDGGAGDYDRVYGDLGDDTVLGGPGNGDEVSGSLGIDTMSGGPGDFDLVHGDYGYDRMDGGAGKGDIASFATDVGAGQGGGVDVSLARHRARGDGHDRLFRFESLEGSAFDDVLVGNGQANVINGGPGDDTIRGGGGHDTIDGGEGHDRCQGAKGRTTSCGREKRFKASAYVQVDPAVGGGGGLQIVGGGGHDDITVSYDEATQAFTVHAAKGIAIGLGCTRPNGEAQQVLCYVEGPPRWLMADLGPGNDSFRVEGSLTAVGFVRLAGGLGDDVIHGGPEDDLIEAGFGADRLYGGAGSDGLVGSTPGPTFLFGGPNGDLLAAGGGCAGGALVGGPGRDDASFAETQAHPGTLYVSFPLHRAWVDAVPHCHPVALSESDEDMEGSFGEDVLIGNSRPNAILGQPGVDSIYGNGGGDSLDARDGVRDAVIQCSPGHPVPKGQPHPRPARAGSGSHAFVDPFDPHPVGCSETTEGHPVPGLGKSAHKEDHGH